MSGNYDPKAAGAGYGGLASQTAAQELGDVAPLDENLVIGTLGRVAALESKSPISHISPSVSELPTPMSQRYQPGLLGSYWDCISMTGVALPSPGTDWSTAFSDPAATLVYYQMPSTSGEIILNGDSGDARFAQVAVIATNLITISGRVRIETAATSPRVQIACNGSIQEFVSSSAFSITLRGDGQPNLIRFMTNFAVGMAELRFTLWDGFTQFWIDPNDQSTAGNAHGSGGGSFGTISGPAGSFASYGPSLSGGVPAGLPITSPTTTVVESSPADATNTTVGDSTHVAQIVYSPDNKIISVTSVAIASPNTLQSLALTAQVADIADTAFTGASVAGLYRIEVYAMTTTADAAAGAVNVNIKYTDNVGARTDVAGPLDLTSATGRVVATFFARMASGSLKYGVTHTGAYGTAAYALYATCEKIA